MTIRSSVALISLCLVTAACGEPEFTVTATAEAGASGDDAGAGGDAPGTGGSAGSDAQAGTGSVAGKPHGTGGSATGGGAGTGATAGVGGTTGGTGGSAAGATGGGAGEAGGTQAGTGGQAAGTGGDAGSGGSTGGSGGGTAGTAGVAGTGGDAGSAGAPSGPSCTSAEALTVAALPGTFELPAWTESSDDACFRSEARSCTFSVREFGPMPTQTNPDLGSIVVEDIICDLPAYAGACGEESSCGNAIGDNFAISLPFTDIHASGNGYALAGFVGKATGSMTVGTCDYAVGDAWIQALQAAIADMLGATTFSCP